jgi:hypothetical protein
MQAMKRIIIISGLMLSALSISAQDNRSISGKNAIVVLNREFKAKARTLRQDYGEKRKSAHDGQQDALEEAYWKNRLQLKREKKRLKRHLKSDPSYEYQLPQMAALELKEIEISSVEMDDDNVEVKAEGLEIVMNSDLIASAQEHIGVPYRYGGTDEKGFDCSGFVQHVFNRAGLQVPRSSQEQSKSGKKVSIDKVQPGDLLFFSHRGSKIDHVGIVTDSINGELKMIHSSSSEGIIVTEVSSSSYWKPRLKKARRIS